MLNVLCHYANLPPPPLPSFIFERFTQTRIRHMLHEMWNTFALYEKKKKTLD